MNLIEIVTIIAASAMLCAIGNRIRGGLWGDQIGKYVHWGSTTSRIVAWGGTCFLAALAGDLVSHGSLIPVLLVLPLMWLGSCFPMFKSIDLGTQDGTYWGDFGGLTLHGILSVAPLIMILMLFGLPTVFMSIASLLIAPCYALAYKARVSAVSLGVLTNDRPPLGELLFGACIGSALAITFMLR